MRATLTILVASAFLAVPAAAQESENAAAPSGIAGPDENMAANATDAATANGLAADPTATGTPVVPPVVEDPAVTDATVTPETGEGGGFPWGLLGVLGLIGLLGRNRS